MRTMSDETWIDARRQEIAGLLVSAWAYDGNQRAWHALYRVDGSAWRVAVILQTRGVHGFRIGVTRDVGEGGAEQLTSPVLTTLEAVIWLGLHKTDEPPEWRLAL